MRFPTIPPEQGRALLAAQDTKKEARATKFGNQHVQTDFGKADSKHEARWTTQLNWAQQQGYITDLVTEKRGLLFALDVNGWRIADYEADARFKVLRQFEIPTLNGKQVLLKGHEYVIDAKSKPTRAKTDYRMKKTLMQALYNIEIVEV